MYYKILTFLLLPLYMFATEGVTLDITVLDETKAPLFGVIVYTDNYSASGYTDENGKISIKDVQHNDFLNFSYVGYENKRLRVREIHELKNVIVMTVEPELLEQIVVIGRKDVPVENILYETKVIDAKEIELLNPQTSADVLSQTGNVYIQKTQMGGGSPIIRGFEANKVLLVVDGVRLNNAIYRNGHLQNAITIDNNILDRAEVILGPGSINYGSDAIGGVVHFRTKDPLFSTEENKSRIFSNLGVTYGSVNQQKKAHFDINYGLKKIASLTSITFVDFDDLRAGGNRSLDYPEFGKQYFYPDRVENQDLFFPNEDPNLQVGSGYSQLDILQKFKLNISDNKYAVMNLQYSTSSNVPRYDFLTDTLSRANEFKFAEYYYGPQQRYLGSIKYRDLEKTNLYDESTYILSYQNIIEDRYFRKFGNARRFFNIENVHVGSFTADFVKNLNEDKKLEFGADVNVNRVLSDAGKIHISTNFIDRSHLTRYPSDGSSMSMIGAYATYRQTLRKNIFLHAGLRTTYSNLKAQYKSTDLIEWPEEYFAGINSNNVSLTGIAGLKIKSDRGLTFDVIVGNAFRAPNIDDFAKIREKNGFVSVPNIDLKPEKSYNAETSLNYNFGEKKKSNIGTTVFYTYLYDAIVRDNYLLPNGDSILIYANEERIIQSNINANKAFVYGASFYSKIKLSKTLTSQATINYTYGRQTTRDGITSPLSHIPPLYGKLELAFEKKNIKLTANVMYNGNKPLENYGGSEDNLEEATIDGTPAWKTVNFYSQFKLSKTLKLHLAFENIFDIHYRPFASGISAPGRNFIIGLKKNWY